MGKGERIIGRFGFGADSFSGETLADLLEEGLGFTPLEVSVTPNIYTKKIYHSKIFLPLLREQSKIEDLHLSQELIRNPSMLFQARPFGDFLTLDYYASDFPPQAFFDKLTLLPGFNAGYLRDTFDFSWQNQRVLSRYQQEGQPYEHLRIYGPSSTPLVDISKNPGRDFQLPGMDATSCWRMWFGGEAFGFFPRSRLLAFDKAHRIEELPNGVVFIELYEDATAFDLPENRERQRAFREWMKFDEIEANAPELLAQVPTDPIYEMEWLDKKTLRCMTWLDDDLKHVRRSKATQRWVGVARDNWPIYEAVEKPPYRDWQENQE